MKMASLFLQECKNIRLRENPSVSDEVVMKFPPVDVIYVNSSRKLKSLLGIMQLHQRIDTTYPILAT